jgi:hypothetical protein
MMEPSQTLWTCIHCDTRGMTDEEANQHMCSGPMGFHVEWLSLNSLDTETL